jgi:quercetin dioxygenase-like cupin family protein
MAHPGDIVEAPLLGARATFLETTAQTNGELLRVEVVLPPGFSVSEHVHPVQEERHHVVSGTLRARVGGQERDCGEGEEAVGPPGVPHAWGNPSDSEALCLVTEHRPALHTEEMLEGGFTIARDLQADKRGALEHLLRMAVLLDDIKDDFYMSSVYMQALLRMFAALGPLGRLLGYEPVYGQGRRGVSHKAVEIVTLGALLSLLLALSLLWRRKRARDSVPFWNSPDPCV